MAALDSRTIAAIKELVEKDRALHGCYTEEYAQMMTLLDRLDRIAKYAESLKRIRQGGDCV